MRRLRTTPALREMVAEVRLHRSDLIAPLFACAGAGVRRPIESMPGQFRHSADLAGETARIWADLGLPAMLLFGVAETKTPDGAGAWDRAGVVCRAIESIKAAAPEMAVIADVCLCGYADHGHCGPVATLADGTKVVDNDAALAPLSRAAVAYANAGADVVAPSDMMDGRVGAIRRALDAEGLTRTAILSYAVKFASSMYGPFRQAAGSEPGFGDRRTYQMDYRAPGQAVVEARLDVDEGADMVMVKPAGAYLDVIGAVAASCEVPVAAYQVSGEYAMLTAAAERGWIDARAAAVETVTAVKRAGAEMIVTYFAESLARWMA